MIIDILRDSERPSRWTRSASSEKLKLAGGEENVKGSVIEAMLPFQNGHAVRMENVFRYVAAVA